MSHHRSSPYEPELPGEKAEKPAKKVAKKTAKKKAKKKK